MAKFMQFSVIFWHFLAITGSFGQNLDVFNGILVISVLSEGSIGCYVTFLVILWSF